MKKNKNGFTLVETVIVLVVSGILAVGFSSVVIPMMNFYFYYPENVRVGNAAADALQIIVEGDDKAKGLRYAGMPCAATIWVTGTSYAVNDYVLQNGVTYVCLTSHTAGTFATDLASGYWSTSPITVATASTLTYRYGISDNCSTNNSYSVALVYDSVNHVITRSIDGGSAIPIPSYATSTSGIKLDPPASTNLFRYYDAAGTELVSGYTAAARVDITINATSGNGNVKSGAGQILLKTGVEVKSFS